MRRTLAIGSTLLALACDPGSGAKGDPDEPSGPPGAASLDELRERAAAALRAGDVEAYLALVATPAFLMKHCGDEPEYAALADGGKNAARAQQKLAVNAAVGRCEDAVAWTKATLDRVEGGEPTQPTTLRCRPASEELTDLVSFYRVGGTTWRVKVANDVFRIAGRYVVLDLPTCDQHES